MYMNLKMDFQKDIQNQNQNIKGLHLLGFFIIEQKLDNQQ